MYSIKKQRNRPLYKRFLLLRKNLQDRDKLFKFKRKKWAKFKLSLLKVKKIRKKKFYDPTSYLLSNFASFFKKKFKYNLQNKQKLYLFYGKLRKNYLKRLVKSTRTEFKTLSVQATSLFIKKLETRLDTILYRARFSYSLLNARQLILHKKVYVNSKIIQSNSYKLKKGDLITFDKSVFEFVIFNILNSKT